MKLPDAERAAVSRTKLADYLLSETHPVGKSKARFFRAAGFSDDHLPALENGLLSIATAGEVGEIEETEFGVKYVVTGSLATPEGETLLVTTVWIIEPGQAPR